MRTTPPNDLPADAAATRVAPSGERTPPLSAEAIANIIAYLEAVRRVVQRLLDDGYRIVDGEIVPPEDGQAHRQSDD